MDLTRVVCTKDNDVNNVRFRKMSGLVLNWGSQLAQPRIHGRLVPFSPPWSALLPRPPRAPAPPGAPLRSGFSRTSGQETGHALSPGGLLQRDRSIIPEAGSPGFQRWARPLLV